MSVVIGRGERSDVEVGQLVVEDGFRSRNIGNLDFLDVIVQDSYSDSFRVDQAGCIQLDLNSRAKSVSERLGVDQLVEDMERYQGPQFQPVVTIFFQPILFHKFRFPL